MDFAAGLTDFISQSQRVLNVTHKPNKDEFTMIAKSTALGILLIGLIGFAISAIFSLMR